MRLGTNLNDNSEFDLNVSKLLKTHTFLQGMTGSGKTNVILKIEEGLSKEYPEVKKIYFDEQEEFVLLPEQFDDISLVSTERTPEAIKVENAHELGVQTRKRGQSIVVKVSDLKDPKDQEQYIANFLEGFQSLKKEVGTPFIIFIDEADLFIPTKANMNNVASSHQIINLLKRGRKHNISVVLSTQYSSEVDIRARRECANRIIGKTTELRDRRAVAEMLGDNSIVDDLWNLEAGEFFVRGDALTTRLSKILVDESEIQKTVAGVKTESTMKISSQILEENVVNKETRSNEEILIEKLRQLEDELKISKTKELTDDIRKSIYNMAYNEGLLKAKEQYKAEKGKLTRFIDKL